MQIKCDRMFRIRDKGIVEEADMSIKEDGVQGLNKRDKI